MCFNYLSNGERPRRGSTGTERGAVDTPRVLEAHASSDQHDIGGDGGRDLGGPPSAQMHDPRSRPPTREVKCCDLEEKGYIESSHTAERGT